VASWSALVSLADAKDQQFTARVKVIVSAKENIKSSLTSYLNRELRSLNDVELVETDPEWELNVLAVELKTTGGYKSGVALSVVIISPFINQMLSGFFQEQFEDAGLKMTSDLYLYPDHWLNVGPADKLQDLCKDVIATFDTKHLEEGRKSFRLLQKIQKKTK